MSINVTVVGSTGINATIGSSDGVQVAIGTTFVGNGGGVPSLQVAAGANITVTTTSGVFTIVGRDVPVQSVNGKTGAVSLTASDLTAALAAHTHSTTDVVGFTAAASAAAPVQSVAGRTGVVSLVAGDVSGLAPVATSGSYTSLSNIPNSFTPASHTHSVIQITDLAFPVNSVNGKTGTVSLTSVDVSAASAVHSHVMADVTDLSFPVNSVNGKTGTVSLTSVDVSAASAVHTHVASDITNLTSVANVVSVNGITGTPVIVGGVGVTVSTSGSSITIEASGGTGGGGADLSDALPQALGSPTAGISGLAARSDHVHQMPSAADVGAASAVHTHVMANVTDLAFPVSSVNGKTGTVSLTSVDVSAASAVHTHVMADVTDLAFPVNSVNGKTGTVSLTSVDVSAASAVHTHVMANVTDLAFPVSSVNGKTGTVSLTSVDVSAASAVHTHVAGDITNLTSVANVVSVNGQTGVVTIALGDALPSQGGNSTRLLTTDGTNASWATRYSVVDPVVVAGAGIAISRNTAAGEITIGANGGIVGTTAALVETKSLSTSQNDYAIGSGNIIRLNPSANVTLTGIAGGEDGVVRLLYNVSTHVVTLATGSTSSAETNRFTISSGNIELGDGDSASVWYDGISGRWRVLTDEVASQGGSGGGGAGFSFLFG
jgi:hypothetical protein